MYNLKKTYANDNIGWAIMMILLGLLFWGVLIFQIFFLENDNVPLKEINILEEIFFFILNGNGLKIFSKPWCKQMYYHPGLFTAFTEYKQSTDSKILENSRIFRMVRKHWF